MAPDDEPQPEPTEEVKHFPVSEVTEAEIPAPDDALRELVAQTKLLTETDSATAEELHRRALARYADS